MKNIAADPLLVNCLWNHRQKSGKDKRLSSSCLAEVKQMMVRRAASIELDPIIFEACLPDLSVHCTVKSENRNHDDMEEDENEKGLNCLEDHMDKLQPKCRKAVLVATGDALAYPNLDRSIAKACLSAEEHFCASEGRNVDEEEDLNTDRLKGALFNCLVAHKNHIDMAPNCRVAIEHLQITRMKDVYISKGFRSCKEDVKAHCSVEEQTDMAATVSCLSRVLAEELLLDDTSLRASLKPSCAAQLRFELLQRSESVHLDRVLADDCERDLQRLCAHMKPGGSRVIECLRDNRANLSNKCHKRIFERDQVILHDNQADYRLMSTCASMIDMHCAALLEVMEDTQNGVRSSQVLDCLAEALQSREHAATFDRSCRHVVSNRMQLRVRDYRLDPNLVVDCKHDIKKFCDDKRRAVAATAFEGNNSVVACLKEQFVKGKSAEDSLTSRCRQHIQSLLVAANLNHHMDPVLASACMEDISTLCADEVALSGPDGDGADGAVADCLRGQMAKQSIKSAACREEVLRLVGASQADIHVDPLLYKDCLQDLKTVCGTVAMGDGRQMSCLLATLADSNRAQTLSPSCHRSLMTRKILWDLSMKIEPPVNINQLIHHVSSSKSRNFFFCALLAVFGLIFVIGLCCGRVTKRVAVDMKNK